MNAPHGIAEALYQSRRVLEGALERDLGPVFSSIGPRGRLEPGILGERFELSSGQTVRDRWLDSFVEWGVGFHNAPQDGPIDDVTLENLLVRNATKWASRLYRARRRMRVRRAAFVGTAPEHDLYWNIAGSDERVPGELSVHVSDSLFLDTGSQAIQFVQRTTEGARGSPDFHDLSDDVRRGGPIFLERNVVRNAGRLIGDGSARAAFAVSLFPSLNPVGIRALFVDKSMQEDATGCLLVQGHERVVIDGAALLVGGEAHQPLAKIEDVEELTITGGFFDAKRGQNWLDLRNVGRLRLARCRGTALVHWNSTDRGRVSEDLVLEA